MELNILTQRCFTSLYWIANLAYKSVTLDFSAKFLVVELDPRIA